MTTIVGVGFVNAGKTYYFDPGDELYKMGEKVIVETAKGLELGRVTIANKDVKESEIVAPLKPIVRKATKADLDAYIENMRMKEEAMAVCAEKIAKHGLDMKLIDAEYTIDKSKVIFFFTSEGRVDFRELVKDLASHFRMRIELRQVGVRDEARMIGGIGICGRPFCCSKWLSDFDPVTIKMAKQQNLSLNPAKISGCCGRLMCCLNYENKTYAELREGMPNEGETVITPNGTAKVVRIDLFGGKVDTRRIEKDPETGEETLSQDVTVYPKADIKRMRKGKKKKQNDDMENIDADTMKEIEELTKD